MHLGVVNDAVALDDVVREVAELLVFARILFELDGIPGSLAKTAFERAAEKLPIRVKVVARLGESLVEEDK